MDPGIRRGGEHSGGDVIVRAARSYIGTLFQHQGRRPGIGLDCAGLVVSAYAAAGIRLKDNPTYRRDPSPRMLRQQLVASGMRVVRGPAQPGDVLVLTICGVPKHLAIATSRGMIHAMEGGRAHEVAPLGTWKSRIAEVFRHAG